MNSQDWTDTLTLLSAMVLADDKVYQDEVENFQAVAVNLRDQINPKLMLTKQMALEWFTQHRDELQVRMSPHYHKDIIGELLANLSLVPERPHLFMALSQISVSDEQRNFQKSSILRRARKAWGLQELTEFPLAS